MFKAMDPSIVRALLEGQHDSLSDEVNAENGFYHKLTCPVCYAAGGCEKRLRQPKIAIGEDGTPEVLVSSFVPGQSLPQGFAHCAHCGTDFDPYSGLIMKTEASSIQPVDLDPATKIVSPLSDPHQD